MKEFLTALMMAWGNFLSLPCPKKVWDVKLKKEMLTMLPIIGLMVGFLSFLLCYLLARLTLPVSVSAFFMTLYTFGISGFMHADGFMDCCDAILSRRDLAERQRILKDSKVGAFAVISMILMALGTFSAFFAIQERMVSYPAAVSDATASRVLPILSALPLIMISVISRATAGSCVLGMKPLKTSQYAEDSADIVNKTETKTATGEETKTEKSEDRSNENNLRYINVILIGVLLILFIIMFITILLGVKLSVKTALMFTVYLVIPTVVTLLATRLFAGLARKNLGGVSGDIAGFSICMGELMGLIALSLMRGNLI